MIIAQNKEHLLELIRKTIETEGPDCDLNFIDVSNITDMSWLFNSSPFTGNISKWNVSKVTKMICMFHDSSFNGDIGKWNVSRETNMYAMFDSSPLEASSNLPQWYRGLI